MSAQFEVLVFRVTSIRYCLIAQNGQVVENWRSASRTEIRTIDLAAMQITVNYQDDNHEVQRPTDWPVQVRNKIDLLKKELKISVRLRRRENILWVIKIVQNHYALFMERCKMAA
ncbi:hypothetical protein AVEN_172894-1 [Araneus ventricosus]|uniref:Uncharacterized protein n=1 Tax=Araneus ventricosus TaxID=182803 RepID=A0A4Y2MMI3_ARAVE|nr:hypothetical protein AVEN_140294-1 [Araneus ventricosus]GBN07324.1 hypothetical protein AVEN_95726-1 [Araneus ventricosus]GBN25834.1 hypothetical protein AVEN_188480-1 [Araneus ventricosus]GBN27550.1 hypothetical protein AVEN_172894-1 [Araneus ventricosus]